MSTPALCCAALLTAAPSARGGVRRLPGRSRTPGAPGFFCGAGFTALSTTTMAPPPPNPKVTMLACAKEKVPERLRNFGDEDDEFDKFYAALSEETEASLLANIFVLRPLPISEEERALQNKLKEIVERCMDLQADAMRRLRPEQRRPLYLVFRTAHLAFASVKVRAVEGRANWGVSSVLIVDKLDVVRKMVSSACSAPLPLDTDNQVSSLLPPLVQEAIAGLGVDANDSPPEGQVVTFALIEYTYNAVKSDIDKMITGSAATSTSS